MKFVNIKLAPALVSLLVGRMLYFGASVGDALALIGLCGFYGYYLFLEANKEEPINESTKKEILDLRNEVSELKSALNAYKMTRR